MSQADFKRRLKALMLLPENQICSDCPERQPRWASLIVPPPDAPPGTMPMGAFCCLECSGSHRRLGVHISFVRSVNLDQWKEKEVLAMENGGNKKVNLIFEARINVPKPNNTASGPVRERFIRDKYERRKFYDPNAFATLQDTDNNQCISFNHNGASVDEKEQVIAGVQRSFATSNGNHPSSAIRKPSDVARKRVEERAARSRVTGGTSSNGNDKPITVSAVPAAAPLVVDLLDFGDFESPEATAAVASSSIDAKVEPALDLFSPTNIANSGFSSVNQMPPQQRHEQVKMTNDDILSMFQVPHQNQLQQNLFAMNSNIPTGMMAGGGNMMMNPNNMVMNNGGFGNNSIMMNNNGTMERGNAMAMNNGGTSMYPGNNMMMMGVGVGGFNSSYGNVMGNSISMSNPYSNAVGSGANMNVNMMMMLQQQQQQQKQLHQLNTQQDGGRSMLGGSQFNQSSIVLSQQQTQQSPQINRQGAHFDQFADFGNFGR